MTANSDLRTLVVGIDAASWNLLDRFDERTETIRSLAASGVAAPLEAQLPPWTPSAWPTINTGVNPGKHGVFSFLHYDGYDWEVVDASRIKAPTVWEILADHGLRSVVVNVPVTYPPPAIDGAVVPGFVAPRTPTCHPPGLLDDLRDELGEYRVYGDGEFADAPDEEERTAEYLSLVRSRGGAFRHLVDRFEPEFGFVQFQQSDTVVHDFPGDLEKLGAVYDAIDDQIASILDVTDPDAVFLVSDHGIGPYAGREFRVNEFLREQGYLETTYSDDGNPSWVPLWREDKIGENDAVDDTENGSSTVIPLGVDRAAALAMNALELAGLDDAARAVVPDSLTSSLSTRETIEFAASTAYMRLPVELGIRLNVAGREPEGVVSPDEYDEVRATLMRELHSVETPDGTLVFDDVLPREDVFEGPYVDRAPDIVTLPAGFEEFPAARLAGEVFGPMGEPWNHKPVGLFVASGPEIDTAATVEDPHALDVAPTVLASLGIPQGARMDSSPLAVVTPAGEQTYADPETRQTEDGDEQVTDRLESLGYL